MCARVSLSEEYHYCLRRGRRSGAPRERGRGKNSISSVSACTEELAAPPDSGARNLKWEILGQTSLTPEKTLTHTVQ